MSSNVKLILTNSNTLVKPQVTSLGKGVFTADIKNGSAVYSIGLTLQLALK